MKQTISTEKDLKEKQFFILFFFFQTKIVQVLASTHSIFYP